MEYKYDGQTINPRNASCQHCNGNASVHFATSLLTVNCQLSTVNWMYTFSAKEKDTETGYSYFGSRYYNSDLSIWLSVDPMSDKYPHQSNYVYCSNNPIRLVDPNGEDEWEVNKSGHIRHVDGSEGMPDKLFVVRGFGANKFRKRTNVEGLDVDGKIMKELTASEENGHICYYQSNRSCDMEKIFNYLADNTNVEWALATVNHYTGTGIEPERGDFLITNHSRLNCNSAVSLSVGYSYGGGLIRFKHSHPAFYSLSELIDPSRIRTPSGDPNGTAFNDGDYGHKRKCTQPQASPNCVFILRHRGYERNLRGRRIGLP